jgi:hypothetical protein
MPQVVVSQKSLQQVQRENKKSFHPFVVAGHMGLVHVEVVDKEVRNGAVAVVAAAAADYMEEETADVAAAAVAAEHSVGCFPESGFPQRRSSAAAAAEEEEEDRDYHLRWLKRRNPVCELHRFRLHCC